MASDGSDMPLSSLRPLPVGGRKPQSIGEFIARVQADRGFRNVTEESLKEEIRAKGEGKQEDEDVQMSSSEQEDEDDAVDINAVRADILRNIDSAHNAAMLALDFVSLLLSKHNPNQASSTLSQALREFAGIGTLGVSKFKDSMQEGDRKKRHEKEKESKDTALGWSLMDIDKTKKAAEKTANNLSKEIEKERTYWKEVLAVKQNGWSVCRLPNERHTLGVRFGFTEASPAFRNKSLAPLRRGDDGSITLEQAQSSTTQQRVAVDVVREGNSTTGHSAMTSSMPNAAVLQARVLEARNTIFSQELWQELHREAHVLASYGVRADDDQIIYEPKTGPKITLALETLRRDTAEPAEKVDDQLAEFTQLSLHLLLSYAHRQNEVQRLRPAPPNLRRHQQFNQYHLIRPIISQTLHDAAVRQCTRFVGDLVRVVRKAGVQNAAFTLSNPQLPISELSSASSTSSSNRPTAAQTLANMLTAPADFQIEATLTPATRVQIRGRTRFLPLTTTQYQVNLLPSENDIPNPLESSYPPYRDGYPDLDSLKSWLLSALSRSFVDAYLPKIEFLSKDADVASLSTNTTSQDETKIDKDVRNAGPGDNGGGDSSTWVPSITGTAIQSSVSAGCNVAFELVDKRHSASLPSTEKPPGDSGPANQNNCLELLVSATWRVKTDDGSAKGHSQPRTKLWRYDGSDPAATAEGEGSPLPPPTIDKIIRAVATSSEVPLGD